MTTFSRFFVSQRVAGGFCRHGLLRQCAKWNAQYPIGTEVRYYPVKGNDKFSRHLTMSEAYVLSGHTAVIFLDQHSGCVSLDHCIAVQPETSQGAATPVQRETPETPNV